MPLEFIPARSDYETRPLVRDSIELLRRKSVELGIDGGVLYYGWPKVSDYESNIHQVDLAIVGSTVGLVLVRCTANLKKEALGSADLSIAQAAATSQSQMLKSNVLRDRRKLKFDVIPILFAPGAKYDGEIESELASTEKRFLELIINSCDNDLTQDEVLEVRSILEGAKAIVRPDKRKIGNLEECRLAVSLGRLEEEIASFDIAQRSVALSSLRCPQRIRGLAGSGKTVILAMKAATAHIENPNSKILFTYYTRSLRDTVMRMITRFFRHFSEGEPDWNQIEVRHGWGRADTPGVYRDTAIRYGRTPIALAEAKNCSQNPFDYVCKNIIENETIDPYYDLILIDEGQDFPEGFYRLCFELAKGDKDTKQIVWAYDELQNIFSVNVRPPESLFGYGEDDEPNVSLERSLPQFASTNDFVLQKCYRNQRSVLLVAHAVGFGLYGEPVQMLENREHWEDVGYTVVEGDFETGQRIVVERPEKNSPASIDVHDDFPLVDHQGFGSIGEETSACASSIASFLDAGLEPHDIMVIAIDDRSAQTYLSLLSARLAAKDIQSNNVIADRYSEPPFRIEDRVTMSTVYRAKGNEAAVVFVLGCDAMNLKRRADRNRLFTAFTRSKAWLRISGFSNSSNYAQLSKEITRALNDFPRLRFDMPDLETIETIQRDLNEKHSRLLEAKKHMEMIKDQFDLTDDDLASVM